MLDIGRMFEVANAALSALKMKSSVSVFLANQTMLDPHNASHYIHEKQHIPASDHGAWRPDPPVLPIYQNSYTSDQKNPLISVVSFFNRAYAQTARNIARYQRLHSRPSNPLTQEPSFMSTSNFSLWYASSALSSNTGKSILTQFRYPITLTFVQFGFVAFYCLLFMSPVVRFSRLRSPTKAIVQSTLPMGMFQVGGHVFSSMAISRIPVSTVHTIKALSPLFTVAAYALLFGVSYSTKTYISLLPLTLGVMLACSFDMSASNAVGLLCAFGSAVVFVSSNIFFKKIMPSNSSGGPSQSVHKLDKINLLFYSSGMAFLLMIPIWLYYDLPIFMSSSTNVAHPNHGHSTPHSVTYYFFMNGTVHFAQNIIAFIILSSTSPVTYSIASLIKRVAVICIAIVWFAQSVHPVQGFGILMTFAGLYMYNNAKGDVEKGEKKMRRVEATRDMMLPSTNEEVRLLSGTETPPLQLTVPVNTKAESTALVSPTTMHGRPRAPTVSTSHHHPPLPLSLKITPPVFSPKDGRITSPVDSYPSPPPSLDSPTSESLPSIPNPSSGLYNFSEHQQPRVHRTAVEVAS
ncbi:hypothetical protein D9758_006104 [Tetrapyrgos nigripes]|uniref:Sugar phosphate transporter domain-containing protein n=1 Tax=Tetrapyrgos nigripes TaxID=182062 RepID=A0A8H5G020_9AGAR|nr:hypothetical protein D9758_006104 [Tetrapyrgos nigripes]